MLGMSGGWHINVGDVGWMIPVGDVGWVVGGWHTGLGCRVDGGWVAHRLGMSGG